MRANVIFQNQLIIFARMVASNNTDQTRPFLNLRHAG